MNISLVSLEQLWEDKKRTLSLCEDFIKKAKSQESELIIFPEMTLTGFSMNTEKLAENEDDSFTIKSFQGLAKKYNIAIIFGLIIQKSLALNKAYFVDETGVIIGEYTKIHPFSFSKEHEYYEGGSKLVIVEFKDHKLALSICYDLRFPEMYSILSQKSDILINIANWPSKRVDHWNTLLKARAIENQLYVIGVNRTGKDGNGLDYIESSNIFDANGDILKANVTNGMKSYSIDKNWTNKFRNIFNTINDRRKKLYKEDNIYVK